FCAEPRTPTHPNVLSSDSPIWRRSIQLISATIEMDSTQAPISQGFLSEKGLLTLSIRLLFIYQ
ncbi:hypothetical protein ACJX0J_029379, partial [Zea mays]